MELYMKIIISPAKKMNIDNCSLVPRSVPQFMEKTEQLKELLKSMDYDSLKKLWKCSDKIASVNKARLEKMELYNNLTPAILAYEGIQFHYMAPSVFTYDEFNYIDKSLLILSGFYGILRPFDGVVPYRLEMQAKLSGNGFSSLYEFWGSKLADNITAQTDIIVNLASKEYSKVVLDNVSADVNVISCVFGEIKKGKVIEKATQCKMARGEMVRYMAENNINNVSDIKSFDRMGFKFSEKYSSEHKYIFIKGDEYDA